MAGRIDQRIYLSPRKRLANATKRRLTMNDPEIIRKLEEIRQELSGIKNEANWIRIFFWSVPISFWFVGALWFIIKVVIPWIRDFLF